MFPWRWLARCGEELDCIATDGIAPEYALHVTMKRMGGVVEAAAEAMEALHRAIAEGDAPPLTGAEQRDLDEILGAIGALERRGCE